MLSFLLEGCVCFPFISSRGSEDHISNERTRESSIEMMGRVRGYNGKKRDAWRWARPVPVASSSTGRGER